MVLFDRDPFHLFRSAPTPFDGLFRAAETFARRTQEPLTGAEPRANLTADEDGAHLTMLVPGFGPDDVEVRAQRATVTVRGERTDRDGETTLTFERSFRLPFPVDLEGVTARVEHGVLELDMPHSAADRPRIVPIAGATPRAAELSARDDEDVEA